MCGSPNLRNLMSNAISPVPVLTLENIRSDLECVSSRNALNRDSSDIADRVVTAQIIEDEIMQKAKILLVKGQTEESLE